jgi:hypothetical protein
MLLHFVLESARDFVRVNVPIQPTRARLYDDEIHLEAAIAWLLRSIERREGQSSSKGYAIGKGWMPTYRETTGYVIPTLLDIAERRARPELNATAERMGEWLASVQDPDGGFVERDLKQGTGPIVFNTGQILHGFNALILRRDRTDLLPSARRAGDFLLACMDDQGCFVRHVSNGIVHTYNVRTAWALLTLGRLADEPRYVDAALANADWALAQQNAVGFFHKNEFKPGGNANTHGIAYVLQGLIEIHGISGQERYAAAVRLAAGRILSIYGSRRRLASEIGEHWEFLSSHVCLTGYAQLAIVFLKLYTLDRDARYLNAALNLLDDVAATQNVTAQGTSHHGGIKGSYPIYGRYAPLQYPNWATKFFIDALLAKQGVLNPDADRVPLQLSAG